MKLPANRNAAGFTKTAIWKLNGLKMKLFYLARSVANPNSPADMQRRRTTILISLILLVLLGTVAFVRTTPGHEQYTPAVIDNIIHTHNPAMNDIDLDSGGIENLNTEITLVTIIKPHQMPNLREFVGHVHQHCPGCSIFVYHIDLALDDIEEVQQWERVTLINFRRLLNQADFTRSINIAQMAIADALKVCHRILFLYVNYALTGPLENVDRMLQDRGYIFVRQEPRVSPTLAATHSVQGYCKDSNKALMVSSALEGNPGCQTRQVDACILPGNLLRFPPSLQIHLTEPHELPIRWHKLEDIVVKLTMYPEANTNTDYENKGPKRKPFHKELELYPNTHFSYLRFDISELQGQIQSAVLVLTTAWLRPDDSARRSDPDYRVRCSVGLVSSNSWQERFVQFDNRPIPKSDDIKQFVVTHPSVVQVDVKDLVIKAIAAKDPSKKFPRMSLLLQTYDSAWVKFHSRQATNVNVRPMLLARITGQGVGYRSIHRILPHSHSGDHAEALDMTSSTT